jgi:CheY-like chemotaxis protein/anti-sigma regulatory factor (Ser/Thr protein kinase)
MTRAVWDDAARDAGVSIEVIPDLADAPPVMGDVVALREVTTNLLLNAVDAMPSGGAIAVTTRLAGPWVEMSVRDTGVGMSPETRQRAMEPFFTTKDVRRTGLGLSVAYGIVTSHRGVISIDSQEGKGTTVTVQLPAVAAAVTEAPRATRPAGVTSLRILVVDDEQDVREALTLLLRQQGHIVACAASGRAALDHLATGLNVDLVLTDLGMPDMTGWAVAATVKERWPEVPVGLITGWGNEPDGTPSERSAVDFILAKPVARSSLAAVLAHVAQRRLVAA